MAQFYSPNRRTTPRRQLTVIADSLDAAGQGIARLDGKTIFVADLLPGEEAQIELTEDKRSFAKAKVVKRLSTSPQRVKPQCRYFNQCGGCQQQHIDIELQRASKAEALQYLMMRETGVDKSAAPVMSGEPYGYRRRARLGLQYQPKHQRLVMGFRQVQSNTLVDIKNCPVLVPELDMLLTPLSECLNQLSIKPKLGHVELIHADNSNIIMIRHLVPFSHADKQKLNDFERQYDVSIWLAGNDNALEALTSSSPMPEYQVVGEVLKFNPLNFIQVNGQVNQLMVAQALAWLDLTREDRVLDLFCGMGNFTLPIARLAQSVVGVEGVENLVEQARNNAQLNTISNATFYNENLEAEIHTQPWAAQGFNKVLLDPARAGAAGVMEHLIKLMPEKIVYVSCNPTTLARDSKVLLDEGYQLLHLRMLDMFPHTSHLESMALFIRRPEH
ncbi:MULTISPECIES: 23S rRNA (uracil(1939)-C(5))-methyltransferase RlmD [Providencia]|uniref:23S rRNA (uracil(1939)-C(5))-methyltransferase RlmD n=1 Tax=Providencia TaxID=586 RepID=UPI00198017D5|nr:MULTISPECIES: 23S rRNA (uracil(1939)-C(5))-methyltransferase RlmD [Providencia]HEC8330174.1 23S rRNA (uracil(1939)-C(5))-methyltransferase RlmD [Providencia rettgeri]MBN4864211.1 23S rRNA (uracil(1939)-C(5))-methyltransferase RlmD [Providencia stuartii]MBN4873533.1 23S rRNA (uracil(1939)-C(5))-methyltransferase RlmD [Providencia stuartii]MBN4877346.1 23S rRNA (uracil(1939)-C(5))-methyltransferase RlmD [Providencia stuartii]MBN4882734.1 23S rRNA (uracil(1939)-C(5))-methyltransferase RlmD [Pr